MTLPFVNATQEHYCLQSDVPISIIATRSLQNNDHMVGQFLLLWLELIFDIKEAPSYLHHFSFTIVYNKPFTTEIGAFDVANIGVSLDKLMSLL